MYRFSYNNFVLNKQEVEQIIKCLMLVNGDRMTPAEHKKHFKTLSVVARYIKKLNAIHDEQTYYREGGKKNPLNKPEAKSGEGGNKEDSEGSSQNTSGNGD